MPKTSKQEFLSQDFKDGNENSAFSEIRPVVCIESATKQCKFVKSSKLERRFPNAIKFNTLVPSLDSGSDCTSCLTDENYNSRSGLCPERHMFSRNIS